MCQTIRYFVGDVTNKAMLFKTDPQQYIDETFTLFQQKVTETVQESITNMNQTFDGMMDTIKLNTGDSAMPPASKNCFKLFPNVDPNDFQPNTRKS